MPRFAANLTMLFGEVAFLDRFALAARAGFSGVEYLSPYEYDKRELRQRLDPRSIDARSAALGTADRPRPSG